MSRNKEMESEKEDEKIPLSEIKPLSPHIRFLRVFFDAYKGRNGKKDIRILHDNLIEEALERTYKRIMTIKHRQKILLKIFQMMITQFYQIYMRSLKQ